MCPMGLSECDSQCVDYTSNANHCGGCGVRCAPGQDCITGNCQ